MWTRTESFSFSARHDSGDVDFAERVLDGLEDLRLRLEDRFESAPGGVIVVIHPGPAWLAAAQPALLPARLATTAAGRRYVAGWVLDREIHILNEAHMRKRAAGPDSLEALLGTADRLYAQIVIAASNGELPPPWTPRRAARYAKWSWLIEGAAQYFSRQVGLYRAAVTRRLREGSAPSFPPRRKDALLLGGTVLDLLESERGIESCVHLATRLRRAGPRASLESAFQAPLTDIEAAWRDHLRAVSDPASDSLDREISL